MNVPAIAVLDYGIGNLRSAEKALQRGGGDARLVSDPDVAAEAPAVVLPGVGSFGRCMEALVASGLDTVARRAVAEDRPFLGICVGMQLLYEASEESPGVEGLGILPGTVRRLTADLPCPQMQWNRLDVRPAGAAMFAGAGDGPWMYFLHSFAAPDGAEVAATCDYGGPVVAAVARGRLWATQFHPEKSSTGGLALLARWVEATRAVRVGR